MSQTRMTKQRAVILETLRGVTSHPTADELYDMVREKLPRISLGTVYRNLDLLSSSGEILLIEQAGQQKRFDGDTSAHWHVRCEVCGCIGDIFSGVDVPSITNVEAEGFTICSAEVSFSGVCDHCKKSDC